MKIKIKKTVPFFTTIIIICLFIACSNTNYKSSSKTTIKVDLTKKDNILFSEIFDSVRYVKLETTDDILIRRISTLKYSNNCVYVLDPDLKALFSFDAITGKYLWKIRNVGQGPGEYSNWPVDFDIDEKNNRLYLFCRTEKIQEYDLSGNFIHEYNIPLNGFSIACHNDEMYIYCGNNPHRSDFQWKNPNHMDTHWENYRLLIYNKKDGSLRKELRYEDNPQLGGVHTYQSWFAAFYHYNDEIRFFSPYFYNIYSLEGDKIDIPYQFDFGKFDFPKNKNLSSYSKEELREMDCAHGLHLGWENDRYLSASTYMKQTGYQILYAKKENQVYVGNFVDDIGTSSRYPEIAQVTNDFALRHLPAETCFRDDINYNKATSSLIKKIRSEITEDDNPVLFFYYFKK